MAQLPASMRRKRAATTSIHEKPPSRKEKLIFAGGWLLLVIAVFVLAVGLYGLYKVITDYLEGVSLNDLVPASSNGDDYVI